MTSRISRIPRKRLTAVTAVVLVGLIVAGAAVVVRNTFFGPTDDYRLLHHRHRDLSP